MTDKREWYQAEYWNNGFWIRFGTHAPTLDGAQRCVNRHPQVKTRIVRYTTEVVEEKEARG